MAATESSEVRDGYTPEEIKAAGLDDFRVFLRQVWDYLGLPPPTPVQNNIAYYLQHGPKRKMVQAFRGVGKSWITVAYVLWLLLLNPQLKLMVVSAGEGLAKDFTNFAKQLINGMPLLQHLAPRNGQRDAADKFDVGPSTDSKDPSVKSVGITGQLTGSRADVIVFDDVETPKNSYTHLLRERLAELVKEAAAILKPDDTSQIIYLGTPQVEASLYRRLPSRGYAVAIWTSEVPERPELYGAQLAHFIKKMVDEGKAPHTPVEPLRFPREVLDGKLLEYGRAGYALQFLLDTNPQSAEKHPLKLRDLIVMDVDTELSPLRVVWGRERVLSDLAAGGFEGDCYVAPAFLTPERIGYYGTVMAIDPSGRGQDETAFAIVKYLNGTLFLVAVGGFKDGFSETTLKALAAKALRHKVNYVIAEENYGGGMFNQLLKPHLHAVGAGAFDEEWDGWSKGQKELRILDTLEPIITNHRLVIDRTVIEDDRQIQEESPRYSFIYQLTRMERLKGALANEDRLEAVSMACSYWISKMDQDRDRMVESKKQEALDAELERFKRHVFNVKTPTSDLVWNR